MDLVENSAMKYILTILSILILGSIDSRSDTYHLPDGVVPAVSLVEAAGICQKMAKAVGIDPFNPSRAYVGGRSKEYPPNSGGWVFEQTSKGGVTYTFTVFFPDDLCVVTKEGPDRKVLGVFKRNGERQKTPPAWEAHEATGPDPFAEHASAPSQGKPSVDGH